MGLAVEGAELTVGAEPSLAVGVAAVVTPLVVMERLESEVLAVNGFTYSHRDMAEKAYRTPVASHLRANRTPLPVGITPLANNLQELVYYASLAAPVSLLALVLLAELGLVQVAVENEQADSVAVVQQVSFRELLLKLRLLNELWLDLRWLHG